MQQRQPRAPGITSPPPVRNNPQIASNLITRSPFVAAQRTQLGSMFGAVVQRIVVSQVDVPELAADLDTADVPGALAEIDRLYDGGKRDALHKVYMAIPDSKTASPGEKTVKEHLYQKLKSGTASIAENKQSGWTESASLSWKYFNTAEVDDDVMRGLRTWVSGDPQRGVGWKMIAQHLRGSLTAEQYRLIGLQYYMLLDQKNGTNVLDTKSNYDKEQKGQQVLNESVQDLRGALDALPAHDGMSYRMAGVASGTVFGGLINVGNYVRDNAFWSTSALRISGSAGKWGEDGTQTAPKVYFIINGATGRYISKHAQQEEGQHEVLFKDRATFRVTKIANIQKATFFVYLTEVDPATLPPLTVVRNAYDGSPYP